MEGSRIGAVMANADATVPDSCDRIDAGVRFLMPGMVEGHAHPSFLDAARAQALGEVPPEDHAIATLLNAQRLLDSGFTSLCSAASAKIRADIAARNAINSGAVVGPRMLAASPELTVTGGLGDSDLLHQAMSSFGLVVDGADAMRATVRLCIREGADIIKLTFPGTLASRARSQPIP